MGSFTSPAGHNIEDAGDGAYGLFGFIVLIREDLNVLPFLKQPCEKFVQFTVSGLSIATDFHITAVRYVLINTVISRCIVLFSFYISILKLHLIEMYTARIEKH